MVVERYVQRLRLSFGLPLVEWWLAVGVNSMRFVYASHALVHCCRSHWFVIGWGKLVVVEVWVQRLRLSLGL